MSHSSSTISARIAIHCHNVFQKLPLKDKNKKSKKSQQKEKGETKAEKTPVDDIGDEEPERLITSVSIVYCQPAKSNDK